MINFRDFGGQPLPAGGRVRRDRLFRSGHLADLSPPQFEQIMSLDFGLVADLRYAGERRADPSPWPEYYRRRLVTHGSERRSNAPHLVLLRNANLSRDAVDGCYTQLYSELPFDPPYRDLFATAIRRFADSEGRVLVHCTAGKDRTGILVGLILHSLGVPRDAILTDYMLSSREPGLLAMKPKIIAKARQRYGHTLAEDGVEMLLDVKPAYLQTAFEAMVRECGSVEAYLDSAGAGPDVRAKLRERLLTN